jgi:hypothetical protein
MEPLGGMSQRIFILALMRFSRIEHYYPDWFGQNADDVTIVIRA